MPEKWILELQPDKLSTGVMSIYVSSSQETCDSSHPENVHKEFQLSSGEQASIELITIVPDSDVLKNGNTYLFAIIRKGCSNVVSDSECVNNPTECASTVNIYGTKSGCYQAPYCAGYGLGQYPAREKEEGVGLTSSISFKYEEIEETPASELGKGYCGKIKIESGFLGLVGKEVDYTCETGNCRSFDYLMDNDYITESQVKVIIQEKSGGTVTVLTQTSKEQGGLCIEKKEVDYCGWLENLGIDCTLGYVIAGIVFFIVIIVLTSGKKGGG